MPEEFSAKSRKSVWALVQDMAAIAEVLRKELPYDSLTATWHNEDGTDDFTIGIVGRMGEKHHFLTIYTQIENLERCPTWLNLNFRDVEVLSSSRQQRAVELVNNTRLAVLITAPVGCEDSPILLRYQDHFTVFRRPMMKTTPWGRICGFENTSLGEIRALVRGVHRVFHARLTRMINPLYFFSLGLESTNPYISTFLWLSGLDSLLMAATRRQFCDRLVNVFGEKAFILPCCDRRPA